MSVAEIPVILRILLPGGPELSLGYVFEKLPEVDEAELIIVPDHPMLTAFSVRDDTIPEHEMLLFVCINSIDTVRLLKGPFKGQTVPLVTCSVMPLPESESLVNLN